MTDQVDRALVRKQIPALEDLLKRGVWTDRHTGAETPLTDRDRAGIHAKLAEAYYMVATGMRAEAYYKVGPDGHG